MHQDRVLNWEGCSNVRDLGGLKTQSGRSTRWGAVVRSDDPAKLTPQGWAALHAYGIRTIISLRTDGIEEDVPAVPENFKDIENTAVAIEDLGDKTFLETWAKSDLWSTPLYYQDAIARWPERHATVFAVIARAQAGGVLIHCARGVDRTGIISLLLLSLLGVPDEEIAGDYLLSLDPERDEILRQRGTTAREVILNALKGLDMGAYLLGAGVSPEEIKALQSRLLQST
ncbi:MAG: tyrosine-protein phosphatase [Anaerolineales bacterium]